VAIVPGVQSTFYDAGHILGSSVVQLSLTEGNEKRTLVFTGDLGRRHLPIIRDPETPPEADVLIIESTYGDREHAPIEEADDRLAMLIQRVFEQRGKLIIPAFAVGRTQELVYAISRLMRAHRIPACCVYVDSPLAVNVTEVFASHPETYDREIRRILRDTGDPFGFQLLEYVRSVEESKQLNEKRGPFIVISASGMMEAGRVLHHLANGIGDPRNVILIVGYQAEHTLGRRILEGAAEVRILGDLHEVKAEVVVMNEFSAQLKHGSGLGAAFQRKPDLPSWSTEKSGRACRSPGAWRRMRVRRVIVPEIGDPRRSGHGAKGARPARCQARHPPAAPSGDGEQVSGEEVEAEGDAGPQDGARDHLETRVGARPHPRPGDRRNEHETRVQGLDEDRQGGHVGGQAGHVAGGLVDQVDGPERPHHRQGAHADEEDRAADPEKHGEEQAGRVDQPQREQAEPPLLAPAHVDVSNAAAAHRGAQEGEREYALRGGAGEEDRPASGPAGVPRQHPEHRQGDHRRAQQIGKDSCEAVAAWHGFTVGWADSVDNEPSS
jgi:hypothetical protein